MKIDSHNHFWLYNDEEFGWVDDSMRVLRRDFLPSDVKPEAESLGYRGCVAVQAAQTPEETAFLLELADRFSEILGVVGWVDLRGPDLDESLERFCAHPKFRGVRHIVQSEPDDNFLLEPSFLSGIGRFGARGLTYDILIYPRHLSVASQFVSHFRDQKFVVDHLAKPDIKSGTREPWTRLMKELARHENVWCKLSGMVTEADPRRWKTDDLRSYAETVLEQFGPERVMIGSDWPVCLVADSYETVMGAYEALVAELSHSEQRAVLGGTAAEFYGLTA